MAKSVRLLKEEMEETQTKRVRLFNPTDLDFDYEYHGDKYTIPSMDIVEVSFDEGRVVKKHLIDFVVEQRGMSPFDDRSGIEKEVEVEV